MQNLLDKGYLLGVDNYYSSVALFDYLVTRKTDAIGTFRKNRKGVPKEVVSSKLKKG